MAVFYPSFNEIMNNCMEKPTEGELDLLKELQSLSDDFEIYFQAHINLAHPDIVILKKGCGALIIKVKDWKQARNMKSWKNFSAREKLNRMLLIMKLKNCAG